MSERSRKQPGRMAPVRGVPTFSPQVATRRQNGFRGGRAGRVAIALGAIALLGLILYVLPETLVSTSDELALTDRVNSLTSIRVSLLSALVAISAIAATVATTFITLRHARRLEADKRLWDKRATVYIDLTAWFNDLPQRLQAAAGVSSAALQMPTGLEAQAKAFCSAPVYECFRHALTEANAWIDAGRQEPSGMPPRPPRGSASHPPQRFRDAVWALEDVILLELQGVHEHAERRALDKQDASGSRR